MIALVTNHGSSSSEQVGSSVIHLGGSGVVASFYTAAILVHMA